MDILELESLLRKSWTRETSADPQNWTPENSAWVQCAVTALVNRDFKGGEILRASLENVKGFEHLRSHYWNRFPDGKEIDFTREQFLQNIVLPQPELRTREYVLSYPDTRKRYALLRLAVENQIQPNSLFSNRLYRICLEAAQDSECQKMRFGCLVIYKGKVVVRTANQTIEPLRYICEPECIRFAIQSRTESMLGACGHAEEWAIWETVRLGIPLEKCSFYIAGFDAKTSTPWLKKEISHTCLRCAVQMYMAKVGKIYVPVINRWESLNPEEAVKTAIEYALG